MAQAQYVSLNRVKLALASDYDGSQDAALTAVINSVSDFVDKYCGRSHNGFLAQTYDELYDGTGSDVLFLNNIPIQNISRIATTETSCLSIHNTNNDMGCRANAQIIGTASDNENLASQYTSTGLKLTIVQSAVTTTSTLTWATYPTIAQLAAAVNALGNGWQAYVMGGFGTWSSSDLRATQGAYESRIFTSYYWIHWQEMSWYRVNEENGEIRNSMVFNNGIQNWRIIYNAGYSVVPDDLQQAICEMVKITWLIRNRDPNLKSESMENYSYQSADTSASGVAFAGLSELSRRTLNLYKVRRIGAYNT